MMGLKTTSFGSNYGPIGEGRKISNFIKIESSSYQAHALHTNQGLRSFVNLIYGLWLSSSAILATMMHYRKGKNVEEELTVDKVPIENLPKDLLWMKVG